MSAGNVKFTWRIVRAARMASTESAPACRRRPRQSARAPRTAGSDRRLSARSALARLRWAELGPDARRIRRASGGRGRVVELWAGCRRIADSTATVGFFSRSSPGRSGSRARLRGGKRTRVGTLHRRHRQPLTRAAIAITGSETLGRDLADQLYAELLWFELSAKASGAARCFPIAAGGR